MSQRENQAALARSELIERDVILGKRTADEESILADYQLWRSQATDLFSIQPVGN